MNVYEKLNLARDKFHSSKLKKTGHNKFANYYYFELGDFLIPALQIFKEVGLSGIVSFGKDEARMSIINVEAPEGIIVITSPMSTAALKGCHEVQNLGAVQTYLRRYLWVAALEIVEHDAIDSSEKTTDANKLADWLDVIKVSVDEEVLKTNYLKAYKAFDGDNSAQIRIIAAKDKRKAEL